VRALKRLARDTVRATSWQVAEAEALVLERSLRRGSEDALDQAWLLAELQERYQWSLEELARRFERSKSWVSGRLALLQALPPSIQDQIRAGTLSAHAAMKYLVPLARVNPAAAQALATVAKRWVNYWMRGRKTLRGAALPQVQTTDGKRLRTGPVRRANADRRPATSAASPPRWIFKGRGLMR
jgi:ParB-like chromosome segregation protein Spo0J